MSLVQRMDESLSRPLYRRSRYWGALDANAASGFLTQNGYLISPSALAVLMAAGRGPRATSIDPLTFAVGDLQLYVDYLRREDAGGYAPEYDYDGPEEYLPEKAMWLIAKQNGIPTDNLRDQFEAWDCVLDGPVCTAVQVMEEASRANVDAALLAMDLNFDAVIVAAAVLAEREIPFLCMARFPDVPQVIRDNGIVLPSPVSFEVMASAIASNMPECLVKQMRLSNLVHDATDDE
jgi:hypothetical protein